MVKRIGLSVLCVALLATGMANAKLMCYLPFDGNLNDASENAYPSGDGTMYGDTQFVPGKYGQALDFDGFEDYIHVMVAPNDAGGWIGTGLFNQTALTYAMWIKMDAYPIMDTGLLASREWYYGDLNLEFHTYYGLNHIYAIHVDCVLDVENPHAAIPPEKLGQWMHVATTWDNVAGESKLYYDGVLVDTRPILNPEKVVDIGNYTLGGNALMGRWFEGQIDELYIFNQALTAAEIQDLMNQILPEEVFVCGDSGYLPGDLNEDCHVNLEDFALMALNWLKCTDMNVAGCEIIPWAAP